MRRPARGATAGRAAVALWFAAALLLFAGTVSGFVGAALAQHSVTVPPARDAAPDVLERAATVLPEFRSGSEAVEFVADPMAQDSNVGDDAAPPMNVQDDSADVASAPEAAADRIRRPTPPSSDVQPSEPAPTEPLPHAAPAPGPGTYQVTRALVDAVANDPESVGAQSTHIAVVYEPDGTPVGLRITGVGRDSGLRAAGIRNGDILVAVNGQVVDSPQRGVAVYQRLSTATAVSVDLVRRGEPRRIRIVVTD